ncbi:MAG: cupin domain-containing protein [Hamadaea sp.]|uniref:cupin domain-containing protein n=1 Tax=Hamadaea sp. TaxID=2024425 RepID=UPI001816AE3A|nr:cupin domain-containing protein [Hamadaea sp.]NUR73001.1 cupin domain-containing protein [Hamadaea sp.]NUT18054.1 cupin domain-containing protein [Hamadaea sp.]
MTSAFAMAAGDGETLPNPIGGQVTIKAGTSQTGGSMTVLELLVPPAAGPGLHNHQRDDELWFVLAGEFRFKAGDKMLYASTGGFAFGPRGLPHAFQNVGSAPGRLMIVTTPSGIENFFTAYAASSGVVDADVLAELGRANGIDFVGPPIGVSDPL